MEELIRILILEHDADDIELIEYELKKGGLRYVAEIVQTEETFEKALGTFNPDIILSDYSLPSFDGTHAFKIKQKKLPHVPFIFVSGAIGEEISIELIKNGVTDYVLKDKLFTLVLKLTRALGESREKKAKLEAEKKLIRSEKLLAEAQAIARIGNWEIDLVTDDHIWSDEMFHIFGISKKEHTPSQELFLSFIVEEDRPLIIQRMMESYDNLKNSSFNFRFQRHDDEIRHGLSEWKFDFDGEKRPLRQYGIIKDTTEIKKAEEEILEKNKQLRNLSSHLQNIREDERSHIAREIHDELGQQLTALKMDVDWVLHKLNGIENPVESKLKGMLKMCDNVINTVRRISSELRPAIIDDLGLIAALEWKCTDFEEKTGISCKFITEVQERRFDNQFGINVYRILQETLTNVSRHAEATKVTVNLIETSDEMVMEIQDNGKGITDEFVNNGKTLGILGMKERTNLLGGNLSITGKKDQGTKTKLILPFRNEHTYSR
jgi:two-component system sensor histidine kinase UhpB